MKCNLICYCSNRKLIHQAMTPSSGDEEGCIQSSNGGSSHHSNDLPGESFCFALISPSGNLSLGKEHCWGSWESCYLRDTEILGKFSTSHEMITSSPRLIVQVSFRLRPCLSRSFVAQRLPTAFQAKFYWDIPSTLPFWPYSLNSSSNSNVRLKPEWEYLNPTEVVYPASYHTTRQEM
jgi:hypothetical protein